MLSNTVSTASSALVLVIPVLVTTSLTISSLITSRSAFRQGVDAKGMSDTLSNKQQHSAGQRLAIGRWQLAVHICTRQNARSFRSDFFSDLCRLRAGPRGLKAGC